ncbi:MAG: alcohol dehydrogenase catalytic domain-containing protein [Acidimicrobiia bacterium]|nr:alcohol dehydrogenase catalytic domain-containing protein [Acidimicrobiia bacterium]
MRAALITEFNKPLEIGLVDDPSPSPGGIVLRVEATGVCRSDWHAWVGHEKLPELPHVPGHEMAGTIEAVGAEVERWRPGDRVIVPFSIGCGVCDSCSDGHLNTCDRPFTPGFTHWGSFAELAAIDHADPNLVRLPPDLDPVHAAALGCRFITAFRAVTDRGQIVPGQWLAVHGCGGVGLSAVMIGAALGAQVVAVDIDERKLEMATALGAATVVDATTTEDAGRTVREVSHGGAHVSIDAVGTTSAALNSIRSLRKHGRHIQVGLMYGDDAAPPIPMDPIMMREIEILGSRGMPAHHYPRVFDLISSGSVDPRKLVTATVPLEGISRVLADMDDYSGVGVTVIDRI